ncbi:MAG TPA: hypothetical protein VNS63_08710 [Blastocatellia bacterium]|nr:hypothetical protein [Blastocatellia bacterium]
MINILSINCSLAFAPYLAVAAVEFLDAGIVASRVVRQAGGGLIIRQDGELTLRYRGRQCSLGATDVQHYAATIGFRAEAFDVKLMPDEIVVSTVGQTTLLSFPQSELWLEPEAVSEIIRVFESDPSTPNDHRPSGLPQWLDVSSGSGRLLLSDGRTGRWVLLGKDHIGELERRVAYGEKSGDESIRRVPPTIALKGLTVHLQSAFNVASALEHFASTGAIAPFEEITPTYTLTIGKCTEGIEVRDSERRAAFTTREARKWAGIISGELDRLNAMRVERGRIRTVFADAGDGRWVLQWGDEVFVPREILEPVKERSALSSSAGGLLMRQTGEFQLLLNRETGGCVALNDLELSHVGVVRSP